MTGSASPLVVACAADAAYALPLAVMLRSLDARVAPGRELVIHVADDGLEEEQKANVEIALSPRCTLHWHPARPWRRTALPSWGRMPLTTYQKLSIEDWLPATLDRVLWLDCDILVLSDPGPLWALATGGRIALAATDLLVPRVGSRFGIAAWHELGFDPQASYFNAGVMLIDLDRWRREKVAERAADYLRRFGKRVVFWDQEALNAALADCWSELDPRWNRNPMLHHLFGDRTSAPGECDDTWIAHFSGRLKPWTHPQSSRYQDAFEAHLDETSWAGWRPPRTWRSALLARYAASSLRRRLFPLEQQWTSALHALTRRQSG